MTFSPEVLLGKLAELTENAGRPDRYVVAFSGGLDSTVLLHALAASRDQHGVDLLAAHIDHGLNEQSQNWCSACAAVAARLDVEFVSRQVEVPKTTGRGVEAAAREARYSALAGLLQQGDWLLSAHHLDDQAETLLLNLLRGSGPAGVAGIGAIRAFGDGWLARPLLGVDRYSLESYARDAGLDWIDDPSNSDRQFDRNYLRHEIMPLLVARWPEAATQLSRSARLAGEAAALLEELAALDIDTLGDHPERLAVDALRALSADRQRNVLRHAIRRAGLPVPTAAQLRHVMDDLMASRDDAQPVVCWPGAELRRYQNQLYLLPAGTNVVPRDAGRIIPTRPLTLDAGLGVLSLAPDADCGLDAAVVQHGLELRYRSGGEEFQPYGQAHTRKLKKLLQERGVVPWMRDRIPLLYSRGELVAVADLWLAADAASQPGVAVCWSGHPPLH